MLNKNKHKLVMTQILKDIYSDVSISSLLGFKGGTAAFLLYGLPRFSVDLDFDLLNDTPENRVRVFERIHGILSKYGEIKDEQAKIWTIFFSLSYGFGEHQIKVEINTRATGATYRPESYLGLPILAMVKESMCAAKLVALTKRKLFVARDLYDVHFFLEKRWDIDQAVLTAYGVGSCKEYLSTCIGFIEKLPAKSLLDGLGELVDEHEKEYIRTKIKADALFLLRAYVEMA